jgi:hypothetical protein
MWLLLRGAKFPRGVPENAAGFGSVGSCFDSHAVSCEDGFESSQEIEQSTLQTLIKNLTIELVGSYGTCKYSMIFLTAISSVSTVPLNSSSTQPSVHPPPKSMTHASSVA